MNMLLGGSVARSFIFFYY